MRYPLSVLALSIVISAFPQWSADPAAPLVVCNASGDQLGLRAVSDGTGGWFAIWLDKRADGINAEVYGQHLDADGYAQWNVNGKLLHSQPGDDIKELAAVVLADGNLMVAFISGPSVFRDSLCAQAYDQAGDPVWPQPTVIDDIGTQKIGLDQVTAIPTAGGTYVGWYDNYFGGSNGVNVSLITESGSLPWGAGGVTITGAFYGPFELHDDNANGLLVQWRTGNGSGAALYAMRIDPGGASLWGQNVQTSANNGGLSYAFHTVEDGQGAQITAWRDVVGNIHMARLQNTGLLTFPSSPLPVCTYASDHQQPKLAISDNALFAAWFDSRPPAVNYDLYLQKFDANGAPLWPVDGLLALPMAGLFSTDGLVASDSGAVIVMMEEIVNGYAAMRVRADGSPAWSAPGVFCTAAFNPFYANRIELPDGDGGAVSFWATQSGDLHAARLYRNGTLSGSMAIGEQDASALIIAYPDPTSDVISFKLPLEEQVRSIELFNGQGARVATHGHADGIDVHSLAKGVYTARIRTRASLFIARFTKG